MSEIYFVIIILSVLSIIGLVIHIYSKKKSKDYLPDSYDVGEEYFKIRNPDVRVSKADQEKQGYSKRFLNRLKQKKYLDLTQHGKVIGSVEMGGLFGAGLIHKYTAIDDYVFSGIENLSGKQFDSITDLSKQVQEYQHNFWGSLSKKGQDKIGGHIGESYVADHFEKTGIEVSWPEFSNQRGWDLLIQDHEVNVKLVDDYSSLQSHFSDYPDIPVVVPGDMQNIPPDAIYFDPENGIQNVIDALETNPENLVIVDTSLSHADTMEQTADATDMLIGGANSAEAAAGGVPFVTMAISGWREFKLIEKQKTDIKTATKNLGLDIAGTGGGGIAGAKGGAIIGSIFGPVGTVVGGVVGGIGGAFGGRHLSNKYKLKEYNAALSVYSEKQKQLQETIADSEKNARELWESYYSVQQEILRSEKINVDHNVKEYIQQVRKWRVNSEKISYEEAAIYLDQCIVHIDSFLKRIDKERAAIKLYSYIYSIHHVLTLKYAQRRLTDLKVYVINEKQELAKSGWVDRSIFFAKIGEMGLIKELIISDLRKFEGERFKNEESLRSCIKDSQSKLVGFRVEASKKLTVYLEKLKEEIKKTTEKSINKVKTAGKKLQVEADKLGR